MKNFLINKRLNLGCTQTEIYNNIVKKYYKNGLSKIDEYDYLLVLNLTYFHFRNIRATELEKQTTIDFKAFDYFPNIKKTAVGYFPICDAELDEKGRILPRFLKKFSRNILNIEKVKIFYRVSKVEYNLSKNVGLMCTSNMFNLLSFEDKLNAILKPLVILFKKSFFWHLSILEKLSIYKATILFEINYKYFSKIAEEYSRKYSKIYVSNFYSAENLGLIKAFLEVNLSVIDVQHGVQNNVVAYQYKDTIPKSIIPTKFFTWFALERIDINNPSLNYEHFLKVEEKLKHGSGLNILISLQPSNSDEFLSNLNFLNLNNHEIEIRLHPRRKHKKYIDKLSKLLNFNFEFDHKIEISEILTTRNMNL